MLESPAKVLPGGMEKNAGNSVKRKRQQYFEDNFGWENNTGGGMAIESERLPDSDQELGISNEERPNEAQMAIVVSPNL